MFVYGIPLPQRNKKLCGVLANEKNGFTHQDPLLAKNEVLVRDFKVLLAII